MSTLKINPFEYFTDTNGDPLDAGYVYIGVEDLDPETNPISVYYDAALTIPVVQPIRTVNGYVLNAGAPASLFVASAYSARVRNKNAVQIYYAPSSTVGALNSQLATTLAAGTGSNLVGFIQSGANAVARTSLAKMRERVTPIDFGAVGDGTTDDTLAIQRMFASGAKVFDFLGNDYLINLTEGSTLYKFQSLRGVQIKGSGRLLDNRTYTTNPLTILFWFDACTDCIVDFNYTGVPIVNKSDASEGVGYRGATFVNCSTGCYNIVVRGDLRYLRYGVRSGDYSTPSLGYNTAIKTYLNTVECGYPIAHYLANNVQHYGHAEGSHRAAYCAGVHGGKIDLYVKDNYIAPTLGIVISDATTNGITGAGGASRGSSDLDVTVTDMGSTTYVSVSWLAAISPSRVDAGTVYSNIKIKVALVGTDTVASTVGAFALYSAVNSTIPGFYPYNWENTITVKDITVSGTLDRSNQTKPNGNSSGEMYFYTDDTGHACKVSNINFKNLSIIGGSGTYPRSLYFVAPLLQDQVTFSSCNFSGYPLIFQTNTTSNINIVNCAAMSKTGVNANETSRINFINTPNGFDQPSANAAFFNSPTAGAGLVQKQIVSDITLTGASTTMAPAVPIGAIILGVSATIKTAITGSSGFQLGTTTNAVLFANRSETTAGFSIRPEHSDAAFTGALIFKNTTTLVATSKVSDFTGGVLRVCVSYMIMTAPT